MTLFSIHELPATTASETTIKKTTLVAVKTCGGIYKITAGEIASELADKDHLSGLTQQDRHNLCDIVWYLKGLKAAGDCPFTDQINSLEEIVRRLGDKFRGYDKG